MSIVGGVEGTDPDSGGDQDDGDGLRQRHHTSVEETMKMRPWMKISTVIIAVIILLICANGVMNSHRERGRRFPLRSIQRERDGSSPEEFSRAAGTTSPFSGLMKSISPGSASKALIESTDSESTSLMEASDKAPSRIPPQPASPLKLIRTGQIAIEVPDFEKATKELGKMIESSGGYIADTHIQRTPSGARAGSISIRVPAASFESIGSKIRTLGNVMSESSNVHDVTKAYSDLETRLRVKREALNRILELLRMRAGNLKEVIEAEKEIARMTEEIERAEGERRFFDHQISMSTLMVGLNEPEPISLTRPSSWSALSESLRDSAAMFAGSLAFMLRLIIILLPWLVVGWCAMACFRWVRNLRKRHLNSIESASTPSE